MKGDLALACEKQQEALELLTNDERMNRPEQQAPWYFEAGKQGIQLISLADKKAYANLCLAATLFLQGDDWELDAAVKASRDIQDIVHADLDFLASHNPRFRERIRAFGM